MTDKLFTTEHEIAVLNIILRFPELYYGTGVKFFMMSSVANQKIFEQIEILNDKQLVPDVQMVIDSLEGSGEMLKVGKEHIDSIVSKDYNKENLKEYCSMLIASYKGRVYVEAAAKVKPASLTLDNVEASIQEFRHTLDTLMEASGGGDTVHIGEGVKKAFDDIVARTANPGIRGASWGIADIDVTTGGKCAGDWWIIGGRPGSGKCLGKGTEVVMYDGSLRKVEEIIIGDLIMGSDSTPRKVLSTTTGKEMMYWVRQNKGIDYRVNESHILSLKRSRNESKYTHGDVLNISVRDYLNTSNKFKTNYKGYKVAIDFNSVDLPIEPYFLGIWLGDGSKADSEITKPDTEIESYLKSYADRIGMVLSTHENKGKCRSHTLIHGAIEGMRATLKKMNLIDNKHIPHIYLANSRENRLQLLAGLLDTDGYLDKNKVTFEITQKSLSLSEQIKYLSDSLGFRTNITSKIGKIPSTGFEGLYYRVSISGDVDIIPTKIERKKAVKPVNRVDKTMTGIHLEKDGIGDYYGFELDGDGLFLLKDMTVTHNTAVMCNSILADGRNGVPILFFEKEMNYQSLIERLVAIDSGVPIQNIRLGILDKAQIEQIGLSMRRIREYPIYLDTRFNSDIHYMEATIYKYKNTKGIEVVYIDYLQLLAERGDNQTAELGQISRMAKLVANNQNVCIIGASQLNRSVESRDNKRPVMSDLRQSGNLEEDADYVISLYRDEYYNKETKYKNMMEFSILKARNGPVGTITLKFEPESNKVENK